MQSRDMDHLINQDQNQIIFDMNHQIKIGRLIFSIYQKVRTWSQTVLSQLDSSAQLCTCLESQ